MLCYQDILFRNILFFLHIIFWYLVCVVFDVLYTTVALWERHAEHRFSNGVRESVLKCVQGEPVYYVLSLSTLSPGMTGTAWFILPTML